MSFTFNYNVINNHLIEVVDYIYEQYDAAGKGEVIDIDYYFKDLKSYRVVGNHPTNCNSTDYIKNHPTVGFRLAGVTFKVGDETLNEVKINWVGE